MVGAFLGQMLERFARLSKDVISPCDQLGSKVSPLVYVHELFLFRGNVTSKIDLLTQRDSPEEHLILRGVYPKRHQRFKPNTTGKQNFKSVTIFG